MTDSALPSGPDQIPGDDILITLSVSVIRRAFALTVLLSLSFLLLWIGFMRPPAEFGWQVFLIALGLVILWLAEKMRLATRNRIVLTSRALVDGDGNTLMRLDDVVSVSRGTFALKPSNGFVLVGSQRHSWAWAPGVYWKIGRRIGVGGITNAHEAKALVEAIAMLIAQRQSNQDDSPAAED